METSLSTLRQAIAAGDFAAAQTIWEDFVKETLREISCGGYCPARLEAAREVMDWARLQVTCHRAQAQDQLNSLHVARQYQTASQPSCTMQGLL